MTWTDKIGTVWQGDCLDLMREMPDKCIDLVVTDPPYGIEYGYDKYKDTKENLLNIVQSIIPEVLRISKRTAVFCGVNNIQKYPEAEWTMAWHWRGTNTYGKFGYNQWQPVLLYGKDIKGFGSVNGQLKSDAFKYEGGNCDENKNLIKHCCPKNLNVIKILLQRLSNKDDIIFDPFMGSWTTAVACQQLGRKWIGAELSAEYCEIGRQRLRQQVLI